MAQGPWREERGHRLAVQWAAQAVIAASFGLDVFERLSLGPTGPTIVPPDASHVASASLLEAEYVTWIAADEAERVIFGDREWAYVGQPPEPFYGALAKLQHRETELRERCRALIREHRVAIERVAAALVEREELTSAEVRQLTQL